VTRYCVKGSKWNARTDEVVFVSIMVTVLFHCAGKSNFMRETTAALVTSSYCAEPREYFVTD